MKKIGFIDHYLNNFHANEYYKLIKEEHSKEGFEVSCGFGEVAKDGIDSSRWSEERGVRLMSSPEEVVENSDFIIVLSPNNPERHFDLAKSALQSGKRVYVDKTFAPDKKTAADMFDIARKNGTEMFSTSALRFAPEVNEHLGGLGKDHPAKAVSLRGPNSFEVYGVHQLELLVMLIGTGAKEVYLFGDGKFVLLLIKYHDNRLATVNVYEAPSGEVNGRWYSHPFQASVMFDKGTRVIDFSMGDIFRNMVDSICRFFDGAPAPAPSEDTLEIIALFEAGKKAVENPGEWIALA